MIQLLFLFELTSNRAELTKLILRGNFKAIF